MAHMITARAWQPGSTRIGERWVFALLAGIAVLGVLGLSAAVAAIRIGGSEVQGGSASVTIPPAEKTARPVSVGRISFTVGQAVTAYGHLPGRDKSGAGAAASALPTEVGLGYDYSFLYTSFCRCECHADAICDGVATVQDVVKTVGVAFRGDRPVIDTDCAHAGRTDVNCDGVTTVVDVVRTVDVAFRGADPAVKFCRPCAR